MRRSVTVQELIWKKNRVEVWLSSCIVTSSPRDTDYLIVPANERLCGTRFAYFPRGGPTPNAKYIGEEKNVLLKEGRSEYLYSYECIDGLVSELGGQVVENSLAQLPRVSGTDEYYIKCPTGEARLTQAGSLAHQFPKGLIHTVAPFYGADRWQFLLSKAYTSAFEFLNDASDIVASPLLGSGSRGIPLNDAIRIATLSVHHLGFLRDSSFSIKPQSSSSSFAALGTLRFVLQEVSDAYCLISALEEVGS